MEFKQISLDDAGIKFANDGGVKSFSGYASTFGGTDSYGDTIHPGAYTKSVGDGAEVKMYFNHGWLRKELPIGKMFVKQDANGLFVERAEFTHGIKLADDVALAVQHKTVNGLSIGYRVNPEMTKPKSAGKGRDIFEIDFLKEVSIVDWPADGNAVITGIKSAIEEAISLKEIEALLRDAGGFSRADACALVARIKSMQQSESVAEEDQFCAAVALTFAKFTN